MNIIGESKSAAKILNMPARIQKIRNKYAERQDALKKLEIDREKKAEKKKKTKWRGGKEEKKETCVERKDVKHYNHLNRGKRHKTRKSKQRATSSELPGEEKEVGS